MKFCKDCKFLFMSPFGAFPSTLDEVYEYGKWLIIECSNEKNKKEIVKRNFYKEDIFYKFLLKPSEINKNNDCPLFEEGEHISEKIIRENYEEKNEIS